MGALIALLGVSGSINVWRSEIDGLLNPQGARAVARPIAVDDVLEAVRKYEPQRPGSWLLVLPKKAGANITAVSEAGEAFRQPLMLSVDSQRNEVVDASRWGETFIGFMGRLHSSLFLGEFGFQAVGISGLVLLALMLIALPLSVPNLRKWKEAFVVRRGKPARFNYDLHRAAGLWTLLPMSLIAITGFALVYKDASARWLSYVWPERQPAPVVRSTGTGPELRASEAVALALWEFPGAAVRTVRTPAGPDGAWEIGLRRNGEIDRFLPATSVWVDAREPRVIGMRDLRRFSLGERFMASLNALHNGAAFGLFGRIVMFVVGLVPAMLFVSGLIAYARRRAKRRPPPPLQTVPPLRVEEAT
jgi:uncharacterized iron-regulated membrane protein